MGAPQLHQDTMDAIMQTFKANNLVVIHKDIADMASAKWLAKRKSLMHHKVKWVSAYNVAKFQLLNSKPKLETLKNWVSKGHLKPEEWFYDTKGKTKVLMISKATIERLNE